MITSSHILKISEDHLKSFRKVDIFVNPGSSDYKEMYKNSPYKTVRFFANNDNKKVYVWDAYRLIHHEIESNLGLTAKISYGWVIAGGADLSGGKAVMTGSDILEGSLVNISRGWMPEIEKKYLQVVLGINWSWTKPYVDCTKYLADLKISFDKIKK